MSEDINYALVESKRPAVYTAMKYWGKKPHNIWGEYIKCYTPNDGKFLDPFSGSAIGAFEAVNNGRVAYAFDINPLTSFLIEVISSNYNEDIFSAFVNKIISVVKNDPTYKRNYTCRCKFCNNEAEIVNYKWDNQQIYETAIECKHCRKRYTCDGSVNNLNEGNDDIELKFWYPHWEFCSEAFNNSFIKAIGGNHFSDIWTKRNLYILSAIFNEIIHVNHDKELQQQLLFGFIQTLHLCSKMCVPRGKKSNRDFSTSWGRSAYICAKRQMEMNPVLLFESECVGKQSVKSALKSAQTYFKVKPVLLNVNNKADKVDNPNLFYGIVDIKQIDHFLEPNSIDFILTDPPYGGLVRYLDLSSIWLSWLSALDSKYVPDYSNEIMISNHNDEKFYTDFVMGLKKLYKVLKPNGKIVLTFNNKDLSTWNMFLNAIVDSGFKIEKVIHQQNKRTGESNVKSKFGMSSSDFYIRCIKTDRVIKNVKLSSNEYESFVVETARESIISRNEPTNFDILFSVILGKLSLSNFDLKDCNQSIENVLKRHLGKEFYVENLSGNKWFIKDYISKKPTLSSMVEKTIAQYCSTHVHVDKDRLLSIVFKKYPNGLTPDPVMVDKLINKYLNKE